MRRWFTGLVGTCVSALVAFACSGAVSEAPRPSETRDAGIPVVERDAQVPVDADVLPSACSVDKASPMCAVLGPAPEAAADIASFLSSDAVPLRCTSRDRAPVWDLRPLVQRFEASARENKVFMMGEVHGTNEIGIVSALAFEALAERGLVDVLGVELPMDYEAPLQRYVDTGEDRTADRIFEALAPNMFGAILPQSARRVAKAGHPIRLVAVDIPTTPAVAVTEIEALATKLSTQKSLVLSTLPRASTPPGAKDFQDANAYFDLVTSKQADVCAELSPEDCERFESLVHALWASTLVHDPNEAESEKWFARREVSIYANLKAAMRDPNRRMYLHMGAFHTNKLSASAGSRMAHEFPQTKDRVFSVGPAYGKGSVVYYGQEVSLQAEPRMLTEAVGDAPGDPLLVSTSRPGKTCEQNPLGQEQEDRVIGQGQREDVFDAYLHYGVLTSERRPDQTTLSRESRVIGGTFAAYRARIERSEARMVTIRAARAASAAKPR
jgi:hypothetical protein